jgi:hypothetical protein
MANELNNAIKTTAETIARYVDNVATMTVETRFVDLDNAQDFTQSKPVARTEIRLDGDCAAVLPVRKNDAGVPVVDTDLFDLHQRNVATAIEYRARMMDALLQTFKQVIP